MDTVITIIITEGSEASMEEGSVARVFILLT